MKVRSFPGVSGCTAEAGVIDGVNGKQWYSTSDGLNRALGRPALLDDVGRCFRDLRVIVAHCGHPWVDEALFLLTKHPNFYGELSYLLASITRRDLFLLLHRCEPMFVPLEKLFFGTDYPGFLYDPVALAEKVRSVNDEAAAVSLDCRGGCPHGEFRGQLNAFSAGNPADSHAH